MRSRDSSLAVWRAASRYRPWRSRGGRTWWTAGCQEVSGGSVGGDARAEVSPVGMGPTPAAATPTKAIFNTKISVLNSRCGNKCNGVHALAEPRCPPAVSYTHLRAHETDSYLVCRLLLEKKKKSPPLQKNPHSRT